MTACTAARELRQTLGHRYDGSGLIFYRCPEILPGYSEQQSQFGNAQLVGRLRAITQVPDVLKGGAKTDSDVMWRKVQLCHLTAQKSIEWDAF